MRSRILFLIACAGLFASAVGALEFREEPYRVGIVDVGQPILLDYPELTNEMNLNSELRDWIEAYGRPEYAEYQRVAISEPFFPYEIRLYYIEGRSYVAFGRVNVSPVMRDYGVRKYLGKLDSAMLQRLLTARPLDRSPAYAPEAEVEYGTRFGSMAAPASVAAVHRVPLESATTVEEVVEIITPQSAMIEDAPIVGAPIATSDTESAVEVEAAPID